MEQQASQDPTAPKTDLESQPQPNHPKDSYAEADSMYELSEDFLNQNQCIIPGDCEYDKMRKTCPMILSQIWTFLYVLALCGLTGACMVALFPEAWKSTGWARVFMFVLLLLLLVVMLLPIYGSVLLWVGIYSKNLERIEKAEGLLMCCTRFFGSCALAGAITAFRKGDNVVWIGAGIFFGQSFGAAICYVTALCVVNRMLRGEPLGKPIKDFFEPLIKCLS